LEKHQPRKVEKASDSQRDVEKNHQRKSREAATPREKETTKQKVAKKKGKQLGGGENRAKGSRKNLAVTARE